MTKDDFNTMAIYSFRYALGRRTYAVSEMVDLLIRRKDELSPFTKKLMIKEIAYGDDHKLITMECDKVEWFRLRDALYS